jgi:LysR family glycine cleavage system transcriptional activator
MVARAIPPLNPLHVFEVAARLGNFTKAAAELRVTQSAVSRQIATLEDYLNVCLFNRDRSGVSLTRAGKRYYLEIGPAFAAIASSTSRLLVGEGAQALHLSVYPTFAVKWLIPRISNFNSDYPRIDVRVTTGVGPVAFASENIDLAIQLMADEKAVENSIRLFSDVIQPVCSPALLREGVIKTIQDLPRYRLLHSHYRRTDWHDWLLSVGSDAMTDRGIEFPSSVLTYQAASEGLGIAMGQIPLIEQDIQTGKLVPLFGRPLKRAMSYYAVWPKTREPNHKARAFLSWLERQAVSMQ